ncbi:MAG: hypothetical protein OXC54_01635, partial [Rhodospirillaceae bacterium]|nr:hypothetical protein [Rhodospirillaceae bacterium]
GALVAAHFTIGHPAHVDRLMLIEQVVIGVLRQAEQEDAKAAQSLGEIGVMILTFQAAANAGDTSAAMRTFAEYWSGPGAWGDIARGDPTPFLCTPEICRWTSIRPGPRRQPRFLSPQFVARP